MTGKRTSTPLVANWSFKQVDGDKDFLPVAQFPTNVHLDLLHHKLIPDPFVGKNENAVQWIGEEDWVYRTTFTAPKVSGDKDARIVLSFEGLDTYATVLLNGKEILKAENMFIPERIEVTELLKKDEGEENEMVITFESAYLKGKKIEEAHPDHKWGCWNGDKSRLGVRKAQYHYVSTYCAFVVVI